MTETDRLNLQVLAPYLKVENFSQDPLEPNLTEAEQLLSVGLTQTLTEVSLQGSAHEVSVLITQQLLALMQQTESEAPQPDKNSPVGKRIKVLVSQVVTDLRSGHTQPLELPKE